MLLLFLLYYSDCCSNVMRNENYYNVLNTILDNSQSLVLKNDFWMITDSQFIMENELKIDIECQIALFCQATK